MLDPRQANPVKIILALVMAGGLVTALFLGQMVAVSDYQKIGAMIGGSIAITVCLAMGKKVWLLIPACWLLTGSISILPLPFSVQQLGILAAFGTFLLLSAFKKLEPRARLGILDILMWINLAYLASVYVRNPVGTNAWGSEMVGGRPYFDTFLVVCGYWVLQHVTLTVRESRMIPFLMSIGAIATSSIGALTQRYPNLVPYVAPFYNGINVQNYLAELNGTNTEDNDSDYRIDAFQGFAAIVCSVLVAYFRPFYLLVFARPLAAAAFYIAFTAGLMAGFRSGLVGLVVTILLSSYFYAGLKDVIRLGLLMLLGVAVLIIVQSSGFNLPPPVQRSLSFIPGPWDPNIVLAAQSSTDWRVEMWHIALESDKYIHNKLLGDGFGFSAYELAIQRSAAFGGPGYIGAGKTEAQLVTGAYHSGPISAVRYVGVVGLILFMIFLFACCKFGWTMVNKARGTPFFPLAIFVGTTAITKPFFYLLVFGGYNGDLPGSIYILAMLNLTDRSIEHWKRSTVLANSPAPETTVQPSLLPVAPELNLPARS